MVSDAVKVGNAANLVTEMCTSGHSLFLSAPKEVIKNCEEGLGEGAGRVRQYHLTEVV